MRGRLTSPKQLRFSTSVTRARQDPSPASLTFSSAGLDEGLALGIAVAAAAVGDAMLGDAGAERITARTVTSFLPTTHLTPGLTLLTFAFAAAKPPHT